MGVAVYLRISTNKQDTDSQEVAIENWVAMRGYDRDKITRYEDKGISGAVFERPGFSRLMRDIAAGKIKTLVTFELSRLSRSFLDTLQILRTINDAGCKVETPNSGTVAFDSTMEQFIVAAKGLVAAQERENISARIKAGMAAAKERGVKLGARKGSTSNRGYRKQYDPALVDKIQDMRSQGLSIRKIGEYIGRPPGYVYRVINRHLR